jgi:hypothetical protein
MSSSPVFLTCQILAFRQALRRWPTQADANSLTYRL